MHELTVDKITAQLQAADRDGLAVLERSLAADTRKGVQRALAAARKRLDAAEAEAARMQGLYDFERTLAAERGAQLVVGLDEVGRGPLAGPVAVGAVVLPPDAEPIAGLNDSKQVRPEDRPAIAAQVKAQALAWSVQYMQPGEIDAAGMTAVLKLAFKRAVAAIEAAGVAPEVILLDGNPLRLDPREVNVVKGDGRCASIAAASIIAKVERDALMEQLDDEFPGYGFASNKGYASAAHIEAIQRLGLSPMHRASFCTAFTQATLF